jgi:hypothetical protein
MILAYEHGHHDKLHCYKQSLEHLKDNIKRRMKAFRNADGKMDLEIMCKNVDTLIRHVSKDSKE